MWNIHTCCSKLASNFSVACPAPYDLEPVSSYKSLSCVHPKLRPTCHATLSMQDAIPTTTPVQSRCSDPESWLQGGPADLANTDLYLDWPGCQSDSAASQSGSTASRPGSSVSQSDFSVHQSDLAWANPKVDGSLVIAFLWQGQLRVASHNRMDSEQVRVSHTQVVRALLSAKWSPTASCACLRTWWSRASAQTLQQAGSSTPLAAGAEAVEQRCRMHCSAVGCVQCLLYLSSLKARFGAYSYAHFLRVLAVVITNADSCSKQP